MGHMLAQSDVDSRRNRGPHPDLDGVPIRLRRRDIGHAGSSGYGHHRFIGVFDRNYLSRKGYAKPSHSRGQPIDEAPRLSFLVFSFTGDKMLLKSNSQSFTITALDQDGQPFEDDLSAITVSSDHPEFVSVSIGEFKNGVASGTLTKVADGSANINVTYGGVSTTEVVEAYTPVLTTLTISA